MKRLVLLLLFVTGFFDVSHAQTVDVEVLYSQARELAYKKQYDSSRVIIDRILQIQPTYRDAALFKARTWLWEQKWLEGELLADSLVKTDPTWTEAIWVKADAYLWSGKSDKLLSLVPGLGWSQTDSMLLNWYHARAWHELKNYEQSLTLTRALLDGGASYPGLRILHGTNLQQSRQRHVQLDYQFSTFDAPIPNWQWLSLEYAQKVLTGPLVVRGTYINRFNLNSTQLEAEWYPRINKKTYAYAGLGFGNGLLFPGLRMGGEIFRDLPKSFEFSAGWRFINFPDSRIHSFTLAAGKYAGKYWLGVRPFIIPTAGNVYVTNTIQIRRYFGADNSWINLTYGIGNSPDLDFRLNSPDAAPSNQLFLLAATLIRLDVQWKFNPQWSAKPFVEFKNEEFLPGNFRTRFSTGTTLLFQFR